MDITHQNITLDIISDSPAPVLIAHQGDNKTRYIDVSLTIDGEEFILSGDYSVIVKASNNGVVKAVNECVVDTENNIAVVELTDVMLDTPGILNCEITVCHGEQLVTGQMFVVRVLMSTVGTNDEIQRSAEYGLLTRLIAEVEALKNLLINGNEVYY